MSESSTTIYINECKALENTMKLAIISHKGIWRSSASSSGYATQGGFPLQIRAISKLFDETVLVLPVYPPQHEGEMALTGHNTTVRPLPRPVGVGLRRRVNFLFWILRSIRILWNEIRRADAVHAAVPGDVGTVGMVLAVLARKPLLVRHCGNWLAPLSRTEYFLEWFMTRFAGGRNVMLATGGSNQPPSRSNPNVRWIYSTSLSRADMNSAPRKAPPPGQARLVITCRQTRLKGTGVVLEALVLLREKFPVLHFDVLGDGLNLEEFKAQAHKLGVSELVTFHGQVAHARVVELIKSADVFCFPSTSSEGFPKAVVEALASGIPVVTTHVSVLPQLIGRGCGILLDEASSENVAAAVEQVLASPQQYEEMSQCALDTARLYTLEGWGEQIDEWCKEAWGQPLRSSASL
jgi:glycosyltransferase involved in cell wall biosynthesis